ncbi:MAG TPA: SDR family NAD(P)-dependent oxidoreductase [Ilumatobacter sp.]|nr:SDR family NAD(P)-dependent oxidoreductase [Ilumatobacter sp.]
MAVGTSTWKNVVDTLIEGPVVTSFTSIGPAVRSRLDDWAPLDSYDLTGRRIVLTGGTSGLGLAAAERFTALGATLFVVGRSRDKTQRVCAELPGPGTATAVIADMGEIEQVRAASNEILDAGGADTLIHNAGALSAERRTNSDGIEATVASQVVGPHVMTKLLIPALSQAAPGRVITMASGGMYAAGLTVRNLQMSEDEYGGSDQYARAKRAQVTLNEMWPDHVDASKVVFHAMHPGWADTPGVEASLPTFRKVMGPLLRSADQGADTLVWLVADDAATTSSGDFWLDRRRRSIHKLPTTKKTDTPERRAQLWEYVEQLAGTGSSGGR